MKNVKLFINDIEVDVDYNSGLGRYSLEIESIADPLLIKTDSALQVKLPLTNTNKKALNHIDRADRIVGDALNPTQKIPFHISINGELFKEGYAKINKVDNDNFDLTLFSKLGEFFDELNKLKMNELQFITPNNPTLSHTINKNFIYENWGDKYLMYDNDEPDIHNVIRYIPTFQGQYKDFNSSSADKGGPELEQLDYPLDEYGAREFRSYKQKPAIRVSQIIKAIQNGLEPSGYTFSSDFFDVDNPYYSDAFLALQSFQDKKNDSAKSESTTNKLDNTLSPYSNMYAYTSLTPTDVNDTLYSNGKFNFTDQINSQATCNSQLFWQMDLVFSETNNDMWRYGVSAGVNGRVLSYELTPDQSYSIEGSLSLNLDQITIMESDYLVAIPPNSNKGHLCRRLLEAEAAYVINPNYGEDGEPLLNPNYDGRYGEIYWSMITPYTAHLTHSIEFKFVPTVVTTEEKGSFRFKYMSKGGSSDRAWYMWDNLGLDSINTSLVNFEIVSLNNSKNDLTFKSNIATDTLITVKNLFDSEMTAKQFLLEYCRLFGLYFDVNKLSKHVTITTRTNYYKGSLDKHWDKYLCSDKPFELQPIVFDSKYLLFNYKDDNKSEYNKQYKEAHKEVYGTQVVDTGYEFNDNKEEVYKTSIFNSLAMCEQYVLPANGGLTLPCMFEYSGKDRKAVDVSNCLIFDTKRRIRMSDTTKYNITDDTAKMLEKNDPCWNQTNDYNTVVPLPYYNGFYTLPYYSTFREDKASSFDIARPKTLWSGQSEVSYPKQFAIFPKFHEDWIRDRYSVNTKRFTGYFNIPYSELLKFDFKNFIYCKGIMWCVERVDVDLLSDEPCKITMVSVDNKVNYIAAQSMDVNYLTVVDREVNVDSFGSAHGVDVYSSNDWQVSNDTINRYPWITFNNISGNNKGTLTFSIDENTSKDPRMAKIELINSKGALDYVDVRQESAFVATFYFQPETVNVGWNDIVTTNVNFFSNMSNEYITFDSSTPDIYVVDSVNNQLVISLPNNNTNDEKLFTIKASVANYIGQVTEYVLTITQEARPLYIDVVDSITIPYDKDKAVVEYESNCDSVYSDISPSDGSVTMSHIGNVITLTAQKPTLLDQVFIIDLDGDGVVSKSIIVTREASPAYFNFTTSFDNLAYNAVSLVKKYNTNCDSVRFDLYVDGAIDNSMLSLNQSTKELTLNIPENKSSENVKTFKLVCYYTLSGVTFTKSNTFTQSAKVYYLTISNINPYPTPWDSNRIRVYFKSNYKNYTIEDYPNFTQSIYVTSIDNVVYNPDSESGYVDVNMSISGAYNDDVVKFNIVGTSTNEPSSEETIEFTRSKKPLSFKEGQKNKISNYMNRFAVSDADITLDFEFESSYPLTSNNEYLQIVSITDVDTSRGISKYNCTFRIPAGESNKVKEHTALLVVKDSTDRTLTSKTVRMYIVSGALIEGKEAMYEFIGPNSKKGQYVLSPTDTCNKAYFYSLYREVKFWLDGTFLESTTYTNVGTSITWGDGNSWNNYYRFTIKYPNRLPDVYGTTNNIGTNFILNIENESIIEILPNHISSRQEFEAEYKAKQYGKLALYGEEAIEIIGSNYIVSQEVECSDAFEIRVEPNDDNINVELISNEIVANSVESDNVRRLLVIRVKAPNKSELTEQSYRFVAAYKGIDYHMLNKNISMEYNPYMRPFKFVKHPVYAQAEFGVLCSPGVNVVPIFTPDKEYTTTEIVDGQPETVEWFVDYDYDVEFGYRFMALNNVLDYKLMNISGIWKMI